MDPQTLELLLYHGEDTKLDYKRTIQVMSKTDREGRADLVVDVIGMANAHDPERGYLLIGVDEALDDDKRIVDASGLSLDDAVLHDVLDEYITPPVDFEFRYVDYSGRAIGVIEVPFSERRFHFVAKDLHSSEGKLLIQRGTTCIRRGAKNCPMTGFDSIRLKEHHSRIFSGPEQPDINVSWFVGDGLETVNSLLVDHKRQLPAYTVQDLMLNRVINAPLLTFGLQFLVNNDGTTAAREVDAILTVPNDCTLYDREVPVMDKITPAFANVKTLQNYDRNQVAVHINSLTHNLSVPSDIIYVTFPEPTGRYDFSWVAHAANMLQPTKGKLEVLLG